jgi:hypothetical protein
MDMAKRFTFTLTTEDDLRLREAASRQGITPSAFVRLAVFEAIAQLDASSVPREHAGAA